jgi:hypothetical protein
MKGIRMTTTTKPRPYMSKDHLRDVITTEAGSIAVSPQEADRIVFDIAQSNHLPANLPESRNGSSVLDIGRGVKIRASGHAKLVGTYQGDDQWAVDGMLYGSQYPTGRELTAKQQERARALIGEMITTWARAHAGDIAQADDIDRNNGARRSRSRSPSTRPHWRSCTRSSTRASKASRSRSTRTSRPRGADMPISRDQALAALDRFDYQTGARLREAQGRVDALLAELAEAKVVRVALIDEALEAGWSQAKVGRALGLSRQRVMQIRAADARRSE